mmetsp:Transcript_450/g.1359  ORF Transcript_450/g.1359 Transcript_450/m.1359 type:complete len:87 (-) Transcript_450:266-526(-)
MCASCLLGLQGYGNVRHKEDWKCKVASKGLSKQGDLSSCGVFSTMYAERLSMGLTASQFGFTQADIPLIRLGIAWDLMQGAITSSS